MTNETIKINRVDLHTSCPIAESILRLECDLEDQQKYTADLEKDLEARDSLIENLRAALNAIRDENNRLNGELEEKDDQAENLGATLKALYYSRCSVEELAREVDELRDNNMALRLKIRKANDELMKGTGE